MLSVIIAVAGRNSAFMVVLVLCVVICCMHQLMQELGISCVGVMLNSVLFITILGRICLFGQVFVLVLCSFLVVLGGILEILLCSR